MELSGRVALVTGASRGIGRAVARALARRGAMVVINYARNTSAAQETLREIARAGGSAELAPFDVADSAQVDETVKKIVDQHKKIDILVNNAGIVIDDLLLRIKNEDWDRVMRTNLGGTVNCTRAVCRSMIRERWGRVINITSVVGQIGNPGQSAYAASKAGIIGFTKAVARELASRAITVNAVAPGFIETEMTDRLPEKVKEEYLRSVPLGRFGTSEEVAAAVCFLASDEAGYITGQVISVNGGLSM
jgi:3-oxoacyl-[acyl-carrier protein] reductase